MVVPAKTIEEAITDIWRNLPVWPTTFGPCATDDCHGSGRGSGPCLKCSEKALAKFSSAADAAEFVSLAKKLRQLEHRMVREKKICCSTSCECHKQLSRE
jgi:hypothetical protein